MASKAIHRFTEEQYLAIEESSEERHEFFEGEMFAMSGGTAAHARLQTDIVAELASRVDHRSCEAFGPDMRIQIQATGLYTYPDASVICGGTRFADASQTSVLNPTVVVEVLSPSTESYDRGKKFQHYRQIESLRDYVLISQNEVLVEHYTRQADGTWTLRDHARRDDELKLDTIGISIPLTAIYRRVEFEAQSEALHPGANG